jgi:HlyD family secretion protein
MAGARRLIMSVVRMKNDQPTGHTVTGGMDRVIEKRRLPRWAKFAGGGMLLLLLLLAWWFAPRGASQTVDAERLMISDVRQGTFDDFLPLRARVTPLLTVYLDAVEGGRVEKMLVEDGATVVKGQLLAILSNSELQLSTLRDEAEVANQLNNLRVTELNLARTRLQNQRAVTQAVTDYNKTRRQYDFQAPLAQRGFVASRVFNDTRDDLDNAGKRVAELREAQATDDRIQSTQLAELRASGSSLRGALAVAHANLDALNLRAPVSGQLTSFSIQVGQSMNRGERLGQIDSPGRTKLNADIDEFYLGRIQPGQTATLDHNGKSYRLKIAKIYPQVKNGVFQIDLWFVGPEPSGIQRGQTLQTKLTLGDPAPARLLPNGSFYNDTGGAWVFVVAPDGKSAAKRQVRLGRRNADYIEVLDGLDPGERVITSPYTGLTDKDRLDLARP